MSRKGRRRARSSTLLVAALALSLSCLALIAGFGNSKAAAGPINLVRLNVTTDGGLVRIEITADGSFEDASVEHYSRGRQTVIRILGARSLLRQSYEINEALAREVRTLAGERAGEPYVDILITLGEGATLAQKKNFNRLVIGVAADFARLRRRAAPAADLAKSRPVNTNPPAASVLPLPSTVHAPPLAASAFDGAPISAPVNNFAETFDAAPPGPAPLLASVARPAVFRGRTIWGNFPRQSFQFSSTGTQGFLPSFFLPQNGGAIAATNAPETSFLNFVRMTSEPPGAPRGVWIPGTTTSVTDEVGGRVMGPGFLRPSFTLGATYDDNYFYRSTEGRALGVFTFVPRLEYEIPGTERAMRLAYESRLRRLTSGHWATGHVFDFDGRVDATPFLRLSLREHFVRSPLDAREYDPAGEVYIVGDTFNRNDAGARAEYSLSERSRLAFDVGYNIVRWSEDHIAGAPLFIDYDELSGGVSFDRDISEETTATISFKYSSGLSDAPLRPQFDGLSNVRRLLFEIGGRSQVSETSGLAFRLGYEHDSFRNAPAVNEFDGLVFDLRFRRDLSARTNFELAALRKVQVSAFNLEGGNARLLSTGGTARLETTRGESLKLALGLNYQQLGFPVAVVPTTTASGGVFLGQFAGERRKDHLYGFSVEAGYVLSGLMKARLIYSFSRRDSTIPVLTFNRNRISLVFELGRRNEVRGRPF